MQITLYNQERTSTKVQYISLLNIKTNIIEVNNLTEGAACTVRKKIINTNNH